MRLNKKTPSQMEVAPWIADWILMVSDGIQWYCIVFDGILLLNSIHWYSMVLYGLRWYCRLLHGIWWYSIIFNSLRFPLDIPKITPRFPQDFPKIPPRFPQDSPKISPRDGWISGLAGVYRANNGAKNDRPGTMVRSEVCNSWCFCLGSKIQNQQQHND